MSKRLGIYAGTFDPVHSGHVAFALQAIELGNLDHVYFLPERRPRAKPQATHFAHRVGMLRQALKPHPQCSVLELVDPNFNVERTLPSLQKRFGDDTLVFLFGSDVLAGLAAWPNSSQLLKEAELIIGLRHQDKRDELKAIIAGWETAPKTVTIFESYAPSVSSGKVRNALRQRQSTNGLLRSVERYSNHHWLYVSLA